MKIGFVIVSHLGGPQLRRLVTCLDCMYEAPPIACHHDFGQVSLAADSFPANFAFVRPHVATGWAKWGIVDGFLRGLDLLYRRADPDWFVLLSAADYPVKPAAQVRAELAASPYDAFIDHHDVLAADDGDALAPARNPALAHFADGAIRAMKRRHYRGAELWLPIIRSERGRRRLGRFTIHLPLASPWHPYTDQFGCHYGDQWITGNRKVANILLQPTARHRRLQRHLRTRSVPDETYYQTVLCNTAGLSLCPDNRRFSQWDGGGRHPKLLSSEDLPRMLSSGAHFARKFAPDAAVLDELDALLLDGQRRRPSGEPGP